MTGADIPSIAAEVMDRRATWIERAIRAALMDRLGHVPPLALLVVCVTTLAGPVPGTVLLFYNEQHLVTLDLSPESFYRLDR